MKVSNAVRSAMALSLALIGTAALGQARSEQPISFDLASQPLASALNALAAQSKLRIIFNTEDAAGLRAPRVNGAYTPQDALTLLLGTSNLKYEFVDSRTVEIRGDNASKNTSTHQAPAPGVNKSSWVAGSGETIRLAQAETAGPITRVAPDMDDRSATSKPLPEVLVTGSHIRGTEPVGSRVVVISREQIDQSGLGRVQDVMETVPQNFNGVSDDITIGFARNPNRGTDIQLRGLGFGTTLVLVDGRRQAGGGSFGAFTDISTIPAAALERIEILADGASAIYGSDAIGGVVNMITRRDFRGAETRVRAGTASGDANEINVAQLLGTNWSSGNVMFGYEYSKRDALLYGDRDYTSTNGDQTSRGGSDLRIQAGNPGNILNAQGRVAFAIPEGQTGVGLTTAQLRPGVINYQDWSSVNLIPEQELHAGFLNATQKINDRLELNLNARYGLREMLFSGPSSGRLVNVPRTNAFYFNPFGTTGSVRVRYDFRDDIGGLAQTGLTHTFGGTVGATYRLTDEWRVSLAGTYGRESSSWVSDNNIDAFALFAALADSNPATAMNVFGDGSNTNPATLARIRMKLFERGVSTMSSGSLIADGPLFTLPAGRVMLAGGIDYWDSKLTVSSSAVDSGSLTTSDDRSDFATFAEIKVPVVAGAPGIHKLDVSLAGRYDEYSDFGSTFNPKYGINWWPVSSVRLYGTYGTSFRAPPFAISNSDIQPLDVVSGTVDDPSNPNGQAFVLFQSGVLPDLTEETADFWSAGLDFQIRENTSLSVSYFDIAYKDKLDIPGDSSLLLANEDLYVGTSVVIRNPTPAQIIAACGPVPGCGEDGPYDAILDSRIRNIATLDVSGIDADIGFGFETEVGKFNTSIGGTYMLEYDTRIVSSAPVNEMIDTVNAPLSLKLRASLSWSMGPWNVNALAQHQGSYEDTRVTPVRSIDSWTTLNLGAGYRFGPDRGWISDTAFQLSIVNAFDEEPPFVNQFVGYDQANGTLLGRSVSAQIVKSW
jgi:iron complex outermembrane recepter protein